jgi:hypothetical protein
LLVAHRYAPLASRVVNLPLEDIPHALAPYWFGAPATRFDFHLAVFETEAPVRKPDDVTFLRLGPTSEYHSTVAACAALSRGLLPPQRNPFVKIYHSRAYLTRVTLRPCTYHVLRRLTPFTNSLVSFQPGALTGQILQSLT